MHPVVEKDSFEAAKDVVEKVVGEEKDDKEPREAVKMEEKPDRPTMCSHLQDATLTTTSYPPTSSLHLLHPRPPSTSSLHLRSPSPPSTASLYLLLLHPPRSLPEAEESTRDRAVCRL